METKRIGLPSILATRDPSTGKDGLLVNCYTEQGPDEKRIVRRPGFVSNALIPGSTCNAQGAYFFNGQPVYLVCDTLVGPIVEEPPLPGTPQATAQGVYAVADPVTGTVWANIDGVGTAAYDGHTLIHLATAYPPMDVKTGLPCSPRGNLCFETSSRRLWVASANPLNNPSVWAIDVTTGLIWPIVYPPTGYAWPCVIVNEPGRPGVMRVYSSNGISAGSSSTFDINGPVTSIPIIAPGGVTDGWDIPGFSGYVLSGHNTSWLRLVKNNVWNDFTVGQFPVYCVNTANNCLYILGKAEGVLRKIDLSTLVMSTVGTPGFAIGSICYDASLDVIWATGKNVVKSLSPVDASVIRSVPIGYDLSGEVTWWARLWKIPDITWLLSNLSNLIFGLDVT